MSSPSHRSGPQAGRPLLDLAATFARWFVVGMSIAAFIAVPVLLIVAMLL
jgi:hypothetical protein